jgi:hypothetical protein
MTSRARAGSAARDDGYATVWAVGWMLVLGLVAWAALLVSIAVARQHHLDGAADLAALSGAQALQRGQDGLRRGEPGRRREQGQRHGLRRRGRGRPAPGRRQARVAFRARPADPESSSRRSELTGGEHLVSAVARSRVEVVVGVPSGLVRTGLGPRAVGPGGVVTSRLGNGAVAACGVVVASSPVSQLAHLLATVP